MLNATIMVKGIEYNAINYLLLSISATEGPTPTDGTERASVFALTWIVAVFFLAY